MTHARNAAHGRWRLPSRGVAGPSQGVAPARGWRRRASRGGFSLVELAIVVAIMGIFAALAASDMTKPLPSWRTRRAAKEFAASLNQCRQLAMSENARCRVRLDTYDPAPDDGGLGMGSYFIEREADAGTWDILPVDISGPDATTGEGTVDISEGGEDEMHLVSIANWGTIAGVDGDDIVFDARGWLVNPATDFGTTGYIEVTFVNKSAREEGAVDDWKVLVSRAGLVRLESSKVGAVGNASGTESASSAAGSGSGYSP